MLTVDHVKLRRRRSAKGPNGSPGDAVVEVVPLCGVDPGRALELAGFAVDVAKDHAGEARAALEDALDELPVDGADNAEVRFGRALKKLVLDACEFDVDTELDPEALRTEVFAAAAAARSSSDAAFDRARVLDDIGRAHAVDAEAIERALYADLGAAHAVKSLDVAGGEDLLERARLGEIQAVLLRAVRVAVDVEASALELRAVLRALKLHQLLYELEPSSASSVDDSGVRLVIEGPMALFQQSTRYGLKLALLLPHLIACKRAVVDATVKLKKGGGAERFAWSHSRPAAAAPRAGVEAVPAATALVDDLAKAGGRFRASAATEILRHEGGVVVPDVKLEDKETGEVVYVEVLGFWSRAAVWKRVELVERGFPWRVIFCASDRLRVSEQALPADAPSTLLVYKGVLRAQKVLEAADRVARQR